MVDLRTLGGVEKKDDVLSSRLIPGVFCCVVALIAVYVHRVRLGTSYM